MEEKVRLLNTTTTEEEINELATQQFEQQALVAGRWGSQLDALRQTQRAQHRSWLMDTLEEYQSTSALNTPRYLINVIEAAKHLTSQNLDVVTKSVCRSNSPLATFSPEAGPGSPAAPTRTRLEESFTIHLGSQLKQTHNIRIVAMDLLDLCAVEQVDKYVFV